jgi:hypothetical protein
VESLVEKEWRRFRGAVSDQSTFRRHCAEYWNACILEAERAAMSLDLRPKGLWHELSYEDLCRDPQTALAGVASFAGVAPDRYTFELSSISDQNVKPSRVPAGPEWEGLLAAMDEGLRLKNY